jgi:hypothetical protein
VPHYCDYWLLDRDQTTKNCDYVIERLCFSRHFFIAAPQSQKVDWINVLMWLNLKYWKSNLSQKSFCQATFFEELSRADFLRNLLETRAEFPTLQSRLFWPRKSVRVFIVHTFRVARWFLFRPKIPNLGTSWRTLEWKMLLYILVVWNILRPMGIFHGIW